MNEKKRVILSAGAFAFASGFFLDPSQPYGYVDLLLALCGLVFLLVWLRLDSDEHFYRRRWFFNVATIAAAFLTLPYYFFRTRGFKRGLRASLVFFVCMIAWSALQGIASALRFGL